MVFDLSLLHDKNVLITGGSSGIGEETAVLFAQAGANVVITGRRTGELERVVERAREANREGGSTRGGHVAYIQLDSSDTKQIEKIIELLPTDFQHIDILVNNAGMGLGNDLVGDISAEELSQVFNLNVLGIFLMCKELVKHFRARKSGHIINLGSIASVDTWAGGSVYCATKHAVRALSQSLLKELYDTPIRVTEIQPDKFFAHRFQKGHENLCLIKCPFLSAIRIVETPFAIKRFHGNQDAADATYRGFQPLKAINVAEEIVWAASRPPHVTVAEVLLLPTAQAGGRILHSENL